MPESQTGPANRRGRSGTSEKSGAPGPENPGSVGWVNPQRVRLVSPPEAFELEAGGRITPVDVEYETYGELNAARDNAILVLHALSGDAHVAGWDAETAESGRKWRERKPGWWDDMIGPGKPLDTRRWFLICANVLGSCYGTTGPSSADASTGKPYGLRFPLVTISDWVRLQARLLDHLGIERLFAVIGGSLGGQQALEWALAFPERVENALVLASSARLSPQGLAFNAVARHAILTDPNFRGGDYYNGPGPDEGLSAARMLGHITYLSDESMYKKFGRRLQNKKKPDFSFGIEFEVESYLAYQGRAFVERFDANSYLYITRAMDYYDAALRWGGGSLDQACSRLKSRVLVVSFSTDWLYPPAECRELAMSVLRNGKPVTYAMVPSSYGHDSFLVEYEKLGPLVSNFLSVRL